MNVDFHELLWQQLNKIFGEGTDNIFVMAVGKRLNYSDYSSVGNNTSLAANNTFELTDACLECGANYKPTGFKISTLWEQLLYRGTGPPASPVYRASFENAKHRLYEDWPSRTPTHLYRSYQTAQAAYLAKCKEVMAKCQAGGRGWEARYAEAISVTPEYIKFKRLEEDVAPLLKDIELYQYGPLYGVFKPLKAAFEENKSSVVLPDGKEKQYFYVSMIPSKWYQLFNPRQQFDTPAWISITVNEHSKDDLQSEEYKKLVTESSGGSWFLSVSNKTDHVTEKNFQTADSRDVEISFKVCSVQINRPWLDTFALKIENWVIPGDPGAWSTGVLDSSNKGSFPLLTTHLIVAKDIKVTAKFSQEIVDTLNEFDTSTQVGVLGGLFSFGAYSSHTEESHSFHFDSEESSITLTGAQVIGYTATLMPKYPV